MLGPLRICDDHGVTRPVPTGRGGVLLAALIVHAGTVVSVDPLADYVWNHDPPRQVRAALQTMLTRLRQVVGASVAPRIRTAAPGYVFDLRADELDLRRFETLCERGYAAYAAADWDRAASHFADALELWQGEPLAGVESDRLRLRVAGVALGSAALAAEVAVAMPPSAPRPASATAASVTRSLRMKWVPFL
ncbi:transcriptional regulator [Kutzneria buriramensis]|uniref:Transcriptional regulator n=1 Tax=Kutzneria buriramensis TaxID=1045776 RepID=A0A3E0HJN1_9PSEU|nr:transcriptional regulator [Kutzneria buriramensis]